METYIMPVAEHLEAYVKDLNERDIRPSTKRDYRTKVQQFNRWVLELDDPPITLILLRQYRDYLQQDRGLRPRTVCAAFCALRDYRRWLVNSGLHSGPIPNPADVKLSAKDTAIRLVPTNAEVEQFFTAARSMPAHNTASRYERTKALAFLAFGAYGGLRAFETLALRCDDLREEDGQRYIQVRCGKGGKSRRVPLHADAETHIQELMEARQEWLKSHDVAPGRLRDRLFLKSRTQAHQHTGLGNALTRLRSSAGIARNITYHCFRHWCATSLLRSGVDPRTVQEILGHASLETTLSYLHTDWQTMRAGIDRLRPEGGGAPTPIPSMPDEARTETPRFQRRPGTRKKARSND